MTDYYDLEDDDEMSEEEAQAYIFQVAQQLIAEQAAEQQQGSAALEAEIRALEQAVGHDLNAGDLQMLAEHFDSNPDDTLQAAYNETVGSLDMNDDETRAAVFADSVEAQDTGQVYE